MNKILSYDHTLESQKNAFITPKNNIIIVDEGHEEFAENYCNGINLYDIDRLSIEELNLYKLWLNLNNFNKRGMSSDFLVDVLGFDKILKVMRKTITTTSLEPHVRFYNYYLMDWYIDIRKRLAYDEKTGFFLEINKKEAFIISSFDREMEEEINEIKSKVKLIDRKYFFR